MFKLVLIMLVVGCSMAQDVLIIDDQTEWGQALIKRMMEAVNIEQKTHDQVMTYKSVIDVMGEKGLFTAYLHVLNQKNVFYSCTVRLAIDSKIKDYYNIGANECHKDH
ncbi:uncharacterized protein LOC128955565 [Oppia nitens]|uniref:uncharacterized protein LOC128955565 n=1 Tax=Oppia nitens TaxID=1686743 RepID=UPI0023DC7173|nr:uncharacterized protein LOC128955565 [Oppia nitens]